LYLITLSLQPSTTQVFPSWPPSVATRLYTIRISGAPQAVLSAMRARRSAEQVLILPSGSALRQPPDFTVLEIKKAGAPSAPASPQIPRSQTYQKHPRAAMFHTTSTYSPRIP